MQQHFKLFFLLIMLHRSSSFSISPVLTRQKFVFMSTFLILPNSVQAGEDRQGIPITPLNSLNFNYRGLDNGGLAQSPEKLTPDELQISYAEVLQLLTDDKIVSARFLAPGDVCFVRVVGVTPEIRIGEGMPTEDPKGWSSPAFVIRSLKEKNVKTTFVVEGLGSNIISSQ